VAGWDTLPRMIPTHRARLNVAASLFPILLFACSSGDDLMTGTHVPQDAAPEDSAATGGTGGDASSISPPGADAAATGGSPADADGDAGADAPTSADGAADTGTDASIPRDSAVLAPGNWLTVVGNRIVTSDGKPFHGRGANLHDTRSCNACTYLEADVTGWKSWADELIDNWHANFIRLDLSAYAATDGYRRQWMSLDVDAQYLADIKTMVTHMTSKPGTYVLVTIFADPSIKENNGDFDSEWPTEATMPLYAKLAEALYADPKVLFGLTNEPHGPPERNPELAARYTKAIDTIRAVEAKHGSPKHIVVVQAPQGWARDLTYFMDHPLPGENIAYEVHPYNPKADFDQLIVQPSKKLPVIIGEYGPANMNDDDIRALWTTAQANEVPHIGWNFHMRCPPDMLQDTAPDHCGIALSNQYKFPRTPWGDLMHDYLATPW
jgi:hypothetical protein